MTAQLPKDSLVLVTAANSYIGAHTCDKLLAAGLRVRGTARSLAKLEYLQKTFENKYGKGKFEGDVVEDFTKEGAYTEALKGGVTGVVHLATVITYSSNPEEVIPPTINGNLSILRSTAAAGTVKRFIATSTIIAQTPPNKGATYTVKETDWNQVMPDMIPKLDQLEMDGFNKGVLVYAASKVLGEKAIWDFVEKEKPSFAVNTVLPHMTWGNPFIPSDVPPSTSGIPISLFKGDKSVTSWTVQSWVDVEDAAIIHVQALLDTTVANRRITAMNGDFNWDLLLSTFRTLFPNQKSIPEDFDNTKTKLNTDRSLAEKLLRQGGKKEGEEWKTLKQTLKEAVEGQT